MNDINDRIVQLRSVQMDAFDRVSVHRESAEYLRSIAGDNPNLMDAVVEPEAQADVLAEEGACLGEEIRELRHIWHENGMQ